MDVSTKNSLIREIPSMSYLKKGDYIRLTRGRANHKEIIFAVADMDGHMASLNYGSRVGNHYYDDPERDYINVKFEHVSYRASAPNTTIYARDGWRIFVDESTYQRVNQFIKVNERSAERSAVEKKLEEAERLVREARAELAKLDS